MIAPSRLEKELERLRSIQAEAERFRLDAARLVLRTIEIVQASHRQAAESWALLRESRVDMARRHVRLALRHVSEQHALIERLGLLGLPTEQAESLLRELNASLRDHQRDLDDIVRQQREGLRDEAGNLLL